MNNVYMKNFAIWLGGPLLGLYIISFIIYIPFIHWIALFGGTIMGIVQTHKEIGGRIQFGKAIGPVLLMVGGVFILGTVISMLRWGGMPLYFFIEFVLLDLLFELVMATSILLAAGQWYMYEKAGKPGWACLVPIYNFIVLLEIAQKPTWWVAMLFIPIANIVFMIMAYDGLSKSFGKDSGFTVGLVLLGQIFTAILGYGDAVYQGPTPEGAPRTESTDLLDN